MPTLFLDIDNTLIYSHRRTMTGERLVAEMLNGKEQSFISRKTYAWLVSRRELQIVPVTTRTLPQFQRLERLMGELGCGEALICNGAILLHEMEPDRRWLEESLSLAAGELPQIEKAAQWLRERCGDASTHEAGGLLVYAGTEDPEGLASALRREVDPDRADVLWDHRKLYCIPKSLNKGSAVRRFSERFGVPVSAAAGDSEFDLPMLEEAEIAIAPASLAERLKNPNTHAVGECACFSDAICGILDRIFFS